MELPQQGLNQHAPLLLAQQFRPYPQVRLHEVQGRPPDHRFLLLQRVDEGGEDQRPEVGEVVLLQVGVVDAFPDPLDPHAHHQGHCLEGDLLFFL